MTTITEDYVSFETAKLLKEKGFDIPCDYAYNNKAGYFKIYISNFNEIYCFRPSLAMAMKWLRIVHNQNIIFDMLPEGNDCYVLWTFNIYYNKNYKIMWGTKQPKYNTYEEAAEEAIKYCIEILI